MSKRISHVIRTTDRLLQRRKFETDYDPINPPSLSTEQGDYRSSTKRTVRYQYVTMSRTCIRQWRAEIIGPFHSALYGLCGFGTTKARAKAALKRNLANNHGFIGTMLVSDKDEADTVGLLDRDLIDAHTSACPISFQDLVGAAGQ